jgi:hypothetical protein
VKDAFDWLFRNRRTGDITIGQFPNAPLLIWLATTVTQWVATPEGDVGTALSVVGTVALTWWAVDEIARGVNPFRRMLGALVLAMIVARLATA